MKKCVTAVLLFSLLLLFQGCTSHFFYPDQTTYRTPEFYTLEYDDVIFSSEDNTSLHAWHIYPKSPSKGLLFVAHGNAQNLSAHFVSWVWLVEEGYELFIFDYRGYGRSKGQIGIKGSVEDTRSALDYLEKNYAQEYFVCGQSLGGTLLLDALKDRDNTKIKAVVIDSTFTGFSDIAVEKMDGIFLTWPFQWIPYLSLPKGYNAKESVTGLGKPILFVHGSSDMTISPNHSWQLFELSKAPREIWLVKEAGHTQSFEKQAVQEDFLDFLDSYDSYYDPDLSRLKIYE